MSMFNLWISILFGIMLLVVFVKEYVRSNGKATGRMVPAHVPVPVHRSLTMARGKTPHLPLNDRFGFH